MGDRLPLDHVSVYPRPPRTGDQRASEDYLGKLYKSLIYNDSIRREDSRGSEKNDRPWIYPEDYGARGDGVTDDTVAIQAAITSADADGGIVLLSSSKYRITSSLTIRKPITFTGVGYGGYSNGSQSAWLMPSAIYNDSQTADAIVVSLPASNHLGGVVLCNFHLRGNRDVAGASAGSGIKIAAGSTSTSIRNWVIKDVWIRDCQEYGIRLTGNAFEGEINNCHTMNNVLDGVYTEAVSSRPPAHIRFRNLNTELNGRYGLNLQGGGVAMVSVGSYYAANYQHGVYAAGSFISIGDAFEGNGIAASGTYSNLYVNSGYSQITGGTVVGSGVSKYNIDLQGGYYHSVGPCFFDSSTDYDIHIVSAGLCNIYRPIYATDTGKFIDTPANSGAVRSSNVVTITTTTAHGFSVGDRVEILEVSDDTMNYEVVVTGTPTTTTFTFASTGSDITSGNGRCNRALVYDESGTAFRYDKLVVDAAGGISISGSAKPDLGAIKLGFNRRIAWRNVDDDNDVLLYMDGLDRLMWEGSGGIYGSGPLYIPDILVAGATLGANGAGVIAVKTGTAPTTSPVDAYQLYSADIVAGNAAPHFRTEAGHIVKLYSQAHVADAVTTHAVTDPGDSPASADALRDDLVANVIPSIETQLNNLGTKINAILTALETNGQLLTS